MLPSSLLGALPIADVVGFWWRLLVLTSALNLLLWSAVTYFTLRSPALRTRRWLQAVLSAGYTLGCGFRAALPRADVQRICLVDSWLSSVAVGRSVATIAELCFAAQFSLLLHELAQHHHDRVTGRLAASVMPLLVIAELFSWYAVLTTDYLGNTLEQSLWAATGVLVTASLLRGAERSVGARRMRLLSFALVGGCFVAFMVLVDVPMYWSRWQGAPPRPLAGWPDGFRDAATRWLVTFRAEDWLEEIPWMSLYFSCAVWVSIALIRPLPEPARPAHDGGSAADATPSRSSTEGSFRPERRQDRVTGLDLRAARHGVSRGPTRPWPRARPARTAAHARPSVLGASRPPCPA